MASHHPTPQPAAITDPLSRRSFSWREVLAVIAPLALTLSGWAHGKLWGLETRTTVLETQRSADVKVAEDGERRRDKRDDEIQATLRRLEAKLDGMRNP